jgi:hypothetical protein
LITHPGLQCRGVVFLDGVAIGEDAGGAGNGGPRAIGGEEGDVDVLVRVEVVGLAGFSVGMEQVVDASGFLGGKRNISMVVFPNMMRNGER